MVINTVLTTDYTNLDIVYLFYCFSIIKPYAPSFINNNGSMTQNKSNISKRRCLYNINVIGSNPKYLSDVC